MNFSFRHDGPAVFVVGTGRCGTTLLTDLIQGERISCLKEMVHYNLLRPFDKLATEPGAPLRERFRRVWRRLRGRLAGPFAIDRRLKELLAVPADFEATVLVVGKRELLARIASRQALEPLRAANEGDSSAKWDTIVREVDLLELYRAWLKCLRARNIPFRLIDASDQAYRPLADERALAAVFVP